MQRIVHSKNRKDGKDRMKEYNGFKNCGSWYKGNIHSHNTISDGMLTPEQSGKAV